MSILRLSHVGICVAALEPALAFYRDGLGFRELSRLEIAGEAAEVLLEIDGVRLEAVYLERDGVRIELLHYPEPGCEGFPDPRPMNALGLTHLSLRVDDLDTTSRALEAAGGRVLETTRTWNESFEAGAVFVVAPDGTRIELVQAPGDPAALPGERA